MTKPTSALFFSDTHVPHHDPAVWRVIRDVVKREQPDLIVHLGDFGDWGTFSSHGREKVNLDQAEEEAAIQRDLLGELRGAAGDRARIVYLKGNHEDRARRWLLQHAPQLVRSFEIPRILHLDDLGIEWEPTGARRFGKLFALHGDQFLRGFGAKYHAAKAADQYGFAIYGHTHKPQTHTAETFDRGLRTAWGLGCTCRLKPGFTGGPAGVNGWAHEFALGWLTRNGAPAIFPVPVRDGEANVFGRVYRGGKPGRKVKRSSSRR